MGLDMYLYAKTSFVDKEWQDEERNAIHRKLKETLDCDDFICKNNLGSIVTSIEVAYWRKANAIHAWFVSECQGGVDDCRSAYVSREKLNELLEVCRIVNADHQEADNLLPSQSGFFFGSTEYDEWYFGDIEETVKQLESVLKNTPENWWFEYQSSW
jgi:hypothetical protein